MFRPTILRVAMRVAMRVVFAIFCASALLVTSAGTSFALSTAEYNRFLKNSPEFAIAEQRLKVVWRQVRASLPRPEYLVILKDQKNWLRSGRDEEALNYTANSVDRASAYAKATQARIALLEDLLTRGEQQPQTDSTREEAPGGQGK